MGADRTVGWLAELGIVDKVEFFWAMRLGNEAAANVERLRAWRARWFVRYEAQRRIAAIPRFVAVPVVQAIGRVR